MSASPIELKKSLSGLDLNPGRANLHRVDRVTPDLLQSSRSRDQRSRSQRDVTGAKNHLNYQ